MREGDADPNDRVGDEIAGKYRLLKLLGAGGMGAVYEAEHSFTKRRVAVKLMHEMFAKSKVLAERFIREARAPGAIGHPGIVEVLDGGYDDDGGLYVVLEMLEGQELTEAYDGLSLQEVIDIAAELLDALGAAHAAGFVHRDIKPDNVFVAWEGTQRRVKLLDFGVAGLLEGEDSTQLTKTGTVLGTPMFMCPEQAKGQKVDHRGDLWAVGAILYDALAGHPPYQGESYNALIVSIVTREHVPLSRLRPDLPRPLLEVIDRALRKEPDERYQSAEEMAGALRSIAVAEAQSGIVVRRKPKDDATRVDRKGSDNPTSTRDVDGLGVAATRPSEPMPQPALQLTASAAESPAASQQQTVPTPRAQRTPRPQVEAAQAVSAPDADVAAQARSAAGPVRPVTEPEPGRGGTALWLAAGAAMIAIAVGVVVAAPGRRSHGAVTASAPAPAVASTPAADPPHEQAQQAPTPQEPEPDAPAEDEATAAGPEAQAEAPDDDPDAPAPAPLGSDDLAAVVSGGHAAIQQCYQATVRAALMAGQKPAPLELDVTLTVAPAGDVTTVAVGGKAPPELSACVRRVVRGFRFRATPRTTQLSFPVVFQPGVIGG